MKSFGGICAMTNVEIRMTKLEVRHRSAGPFPADGRLSSYARQGISWNVSPLAACQWEND
ncbi:MAG TPA: hypothetical protein VML55_19895, partial [Planctomycetaceae bacterium]|nr:hypothetical protein [Planctomycetaceae bacterium]